MTCPPVLNERQGFFCIRGSDLDRMVADDFRALEAWLAHADFVAPRKQPQPQPHQTEAQPSETAVDPIVA